MGEEHLHRHRFFGIDFSIPLLDQRRAVATCGEILLDLFVPRLGVLFIEPDYEGGLFRFWKFGDGLFNGLQASYDKATISGTRMQASRENASVT